MGNWKHSRVISLIAAPLVVLSIAGCGESEAEATPSTSSPVEEAAPSSNSLSAQYEQCTGGVDRMDSSECIFDEHDRQDQRLNAAYKALQGKQSSSEVRDMQRGWIAWVEPYCELYAASTGTSIAITQAECLALKTKEQADFLEQLASLP